jgi:hypothetical protein
LLQTEDERFILARELDERVCMQSKVFDEISDYSNGTEKSADFIYTVPTCE